MNIYVLDKDPVKAALYHNDRHVIKQILETVQVLSTAHVVLDGEQSARSRVPMVLRPSHVNHPSAVWARECKQNYEWTHRLLVALCDQYRARFHKDHLYARTAVVEELSFSPLNIPVMLQTTPFAQAIPPEFKRSNAVEGYRAYYRGAKQHLAGWSAPSKEPEWWRDHDNGRARDLSGRIVR